MYLYGLLDVDAGAPDGAEQVVEAAHLLHQHGVHALLVAGGVAPQRRLQVEVRRQLAQDVGCHFKHHVVCGFGVSASGARLIRDTERRSEQGGVSLKMTAFWEKLSFFASPVSHHVFLFKYSKV